MLGNFHALWRGTASWGLTSAAIILELTLLKHAGILVDGRGFRINMQRLIVGSIEAWRKKDYGSESCD